jgi:ABC-type sugar transport system permease subunit
MAFASLKSRQTRRELKWGLIFITPWILGFLIFNLYPTLASFYFSFTDKALVRPPEFVGFDNYVRLLTRDKQFIKISATRLHGRLRRPLGIVVAFPTALLLNMKVRGRPGSGRSITCRPWCRRWRAPALAVDPQPAVRHHEPGAGDHRVTVASLVR